MRSVFPVNTLSKSAGDELGAACKTNATRSNCSMGAMGSWTGPTMPARSDGRKQGPTRTTPPFQNPTRSPLRTGLRCRVRLPHLRFTPEEGSAEAEPVDVPWNLRSPGVDLRIISPNDRLPGGPAHATSQLICSCPLPWLGPPLMAPPLAPTRSGRGDVRPSLLRSIEPCPRHFPSSSPRASPQRLN